MLWVSSRVALVVAVTILPKIIKWYKKVKNEYLEDMYSGRDYLEMNIYSDNIQLNLTTLDDVTTQYFCSLDTLHRHMHY